MSSFWVDLANSLPAIITALIALYIAVRKTPTEIAAKKSDTKKSDAEANKSDAEADSIHAQVADRWAEHVKDLQDQVKALTLDVAQVRRENEMYRIELYQRDQVIADLKDWAERLLNQLREHAPHVSPEKYVTHSLKTNPSTKFEDKA